MIAPTQAGRTLNTVISREAQHPEKRITDENIVKFGPANRRMVEWNAVQTVRTDDGVIYAAGAEIAAKESVRLRGVQAGKY